MCFSKNEAVCLNLLFGKLVSYMLVSVNEGVYVHSSANACKYSNISFFYFLIFHFSLPDQIKQGWDSGYGTVPQLIDDHWHNALGHFKTI